VSEQNVERHRRAYDAFNARDMEACIALCDPSVERASEMTVPGGTAYQGHDGVRKYFGDLEEAWGDELRVEPEAFLTSATARSHSL
jgi:ketosteroid isomerase-like protein